MSRHVVQVIYKVCYEEMKPNDKFKTGSIFSQLANINKFIQLIKQEANEDELEFNRNDQLISRSESEHRIFMIFFVVSLINLGILTIFTVISYKTFDEELQIIPVEIPIQFKVPYLQTILKNGSVYWNQHKNKSFAPSEHKFDLLPNADYYFSFEYKEKNSYVYGYGFKNHMFHHFKTINDHNRQKKHQFLVANTYWDQGHPTWKSKTGFNSTVSQIGKYLLIFGGGINTVGNGCFTSRIRCKLFGEVSSDPHQNNDHCNCSRSNNLFIFSTKRAVSIPHDVRFPSGFGFYSGCHVTLNTQKILMIGGHYMTWNEHQFENHEQLALPEEYFVRNPPNNQVIQLDVLKNKWHLLPNVPIDMNMNGLDVHYVCATSISKNYTRYTLFSRS